MTLAQASLARMNRDPKAAVALLEKEYTARPTDIRVWREMAAVMVDQKDYEARSLGCSQPPPGRTAECRASVSARGALRHNGALGRG
jgi:hypothetical protein